MSMIGQGLKLTKSNKVYNLGQRLRPKKSERIARKWRIRDKRDQKSMPSCVGHGVFHYLRSSPHANISKQLGPNEIYFGAQRYDEWPGENYEGTSVSGAMNFLLSHPQIDINNFYRLETLDDLINYLLDWGPVVAGTVWTMDMNLVDDRGFITISGDEVGGHAYLIYGIKIFKTYAREDDEYMIDYDRSYVEILNSWGPGWGIKGTAKISLWHLDQLFDQYSEFLAPVKIV